MTPDFTSIAQAALRAGPGLLMAWLPGGRMHGHEYDVLNPTRGDRATGNFRINTITGKWSDFATQDAGGDLISLYAYLENSSQSDAAEEIARQLGINGYAERGIDPAIAPFLSSIRIKPTVDADTCLMPVPDDAPPAPMGAGQAIWTYTNHHDALLGYVRRIDKPDGKKEFRPLTYWQAGGWQAKSWPRPAPLYGQSGLAARLESPVVVVEGEKTNDAATRLLADYVAVTWPGGSSRATHADWRQLAGRRVWLLPDADDPGKKAMAAVAESLRGIVAELYLATLPADLPVGWDIADFTGDTDEARDWFVALDWRALKAPIPADAKPDSRFDVELKRANGQGPQYVTIEAPRWKPKAIPVPVLARLEQEILRRVPIQHPIAAQQTALVIAARLAGRHTVTTAGDPTNLYVALAAPSVSDVRPYLQQAEAIMEQAGLQQSVRKSRLSIMAQVQKVLWRQPATLYLCSEWGILLQFAKRQPAGSLEMALGLIAELWDGKPMTIDADDVKLPDADGGQQIVRAPHLSMLALLSHDQLATAVKLSEMGRGALDQIQYWILNDDDFVVVDPDAITTDPYPDDLIAELQRMSVSPIPPTGNLAGSTPWVLPPQVQARFAVAIQPFYAELDDLQTHRSARAILTTTRLIVRRITNALAYLHCQTSPLITAPLIEWCMDEEMARLRTLFSWFPSLSGEDGKISAYDKVLEFIASEKSKGAGARALQQYCRPYRNLPDDKREALLKQMLADESVVEIQPESKPGARRKAPVYVARQFVREVGK